MSIEEAIAESDNWFVGEDKIFQFAIKQADGTTPQNITGWGLEWVLRKNKSAPDPAVLTKTNASGISITDGAGGICQVAIADGDTVALAPGTYFHTLRRSDDGSETVLTFGDAVLRHGATR